MLAYCTWRTLTLRRLNSRLYFSLHQVYLAEMWQFSWHCWTVLFCTLVILDPRVDHTMDVLSPFISVLCYSDCSTGSPVHVLMLSIQAVCGLPRCWHLALSLSPSNSLFPSWFDHITVHIAACDQQMTVCGLHNVCGLQAISRHLLGRDSQLLNKTSSYHI